MLTIMMGTLRSAVVDVYSLLTAHRTDSNWHGSVALEHYDSSISDRSAM